uniref:Uncharacterized protein n=1 Tax=Aegilops tauschii subsp. strangulata TaxID=200361 RepID=A0A452ZAP0_AEGTS
ASICRADIKFPVISMEDLSTWLCFFVSLTILAFAAFSMCCQTSTTASSTGKTPM